MKKNLILLLILALSVSCKSVEEKAGELIRTEFSKTLYDYESYTPIETEMSEARLSVFTDSTCRVKALLIVYGLKEAEQYISDAHSAAESMVLWGEPDYYTSSYSDRQYYKHKEELDGNIEKLKQAVELINRFTEELNEAAQKLDTTKVIGWEAEHSFRCKTKGGQSDIGKYRFVFNEDLDRILFYDDLDDKDIQRAHEILQAAEKNELKKLLE